MRVGNRCRRCVHRDDRHQPTIAVWVAEVDHEVFWTFDQNVIGDRHFKIEWRHRIAVGSGGVHKRRSVKGQCARTGVVVHRIGQSRNEVAIVRRSRVDVGDADIDHRSFAGLHRAFETNRKRSVVAFIDLRHPSDRPLKRSIVVDNSSGYAFVIGIDFNSRSIGVSRVGQVDRVVFWAFAQRVFRDVEANH